MVSHAYASMHLLDLHKEIGKRLCGQLKILFQGAIQPWLRGTSLRGGVTVSADQAL